MLKDGSSPRMRGTPRRQQWNRLIRRFIPAHARNSSDGYRDRVMRDGTSTRTAGNSTPSPVDSAVSSGSSPRMRGTQRRRQAAPGPFRFIPAHAGTSIRAAFGQRAITGSSPRMRGTQYHRGTVVHPQRLHRFIPAHAGNSRARVVNLDAHRRFIPAHAGNSRMGDFHLMPLPVHPRACGELPTLADALGVLLGSSPRMRGTPCDRARGHGRSRFIPAHAGNSPTDDALYSALNGSSPRMRGTRFEPIAWW